ncbi:hypothetical protein [Pseudomonas sp.]|nr:hypothetical protein [Pseudomonas sp.]MDX1369293.1 hypothetical protein [Pseudomonas sp.]
MKRWLGIAVGLQAGDGAASRLSLDNELRKHLYLLGLLDSLNQWQRQAL